jgi:hypothetical protein
LRRALTNVGLMMMIGLVNLPPPPSPPLYRRLGTFKLSEGSIVLTGPGNTSAGGPGKETYIVLGGSGKYLGASGTALYDGTVDPATYAITLTY